MKTCSNLGFPPQQKKENKAAESWVINHNHGYEIKEQKSNNDVIYKGGWYGN